MARALLSHKRRWQHNRLILSHDNDIILNCDQTSWRLYPKILTLNIRLHCVPACMTDALQRVDRSTFDALKAHVQRLFRIRVRDNPTL
jgi:hypothetical protein